MIESAFGFDIQPGEWRLNKKMAGGGPLMDVGIYCLNASRYLTGEEPAEIKANASVIDHDGRFNEVEENDGWTMKFPSGIVASCSTTYGANGANYFRVHGSKGRMAMDPAFNYDGMHLTARLADGQKIDEPEQEQIRATSRSRPIILPVACGTTASRKRMGRRVCGIPRTCRRFTSRLG